MLRWGGVGLSCVLTMAYLTDADGVSSIDGRSVSRIIDMTDDNHQHHAMVDDDGR